MKFINWAKNPTQNKIQQADSTQLELLPFIFQFICIGISILSFASSLIFYYLQHNISAHISTGIFLFGILSLFTYKKTNSKAILHLFVIAFITGLNFLIIYSPLSSVIYFFAPLPIMLVLLFKIKGGTLYTILAAFSLIVINLNGLYKIQTSELIIFFLAYFLLYGVALAYEFISFVRLSENSISQTRIATHSKLQLKQKTELHDFSYNLRTPLTSILGLIEFYKTEKNESIISDIENETQQIIKILDLKISTPKPSIKHSGSLNISNLVQEKISEITQDLSISKFNSQIHYSDIKDLEIQGNVNDFLTLTNEVYTCIFNNRKGHLDIDTHISPLFESTTTSTYLFEIHILGLQKLAYPAPAEIDILSDSYKNMNMTVFKSEAKNTSNIDLPKSLQILDNIQAKIGISHTLEGQTTIAFTFTFWKKEIHVKAISGSEEKHTFALSESTILIVEDNIMNQQMLALILKKRAKQIIVAANGKEALNKFSSAKIDLILMDIQMPILDGYKTTKKIREMELGLGKRTPIIALTANAMNNEKEECFAVGMDGYLSKPFGVDDLITTIQNTVEKVRK